MAELVPLKVKIKLKPNGQARYPDFNSLDGSVRDNQDWCIFVDTFGGWYYDKVSGHTDHSPAANSPRGIQFGLLLVPEDFADAALAAFPNLVTELNEADTLTFYENRHTKHQPAIFDDPEELSAIKARRDLGLADDDDVTDALDINSPRRGRRKNKRKTFADFKSDTGHTIKPGRGV